VLTGSHSHGQGHETTFAQLVSDRLGVPLEKVSIVHGDTDKVQFGMGTYGSRSGAVGMSAILKAMDKVDRQGQEDRRPPAGGVEADIEFKDGNFSVAGTDKEIASDISRCRLRRAQLPDRRIEPGLKETAFYDPTNFTFPAGCPHLRGRDRSRHGHRGQDRELHGRRRFRQRHQPDDRRGPGPWRHRPGHRPGAARRRCVYDSRWPAPDGDLHGLLHAARRRPAVSFNVGMTTTVCPSQPARHEGLRRGRGIGSPPAVINAITDALGVRELQDAGTPAGRHAGDARWRPKSGRGGRINGDAPAAMAAE
jgi:carbon-monoxide dehydrogenase large subunit